MGGGTGYWVREGDFEMIKFEMIKFEMGWMGKRGFGGRLK